MNGPEFVASGGGSAARRGVNDCCLHLLTLLLQVGELDSHYLLRLNHVEYLFIGIVLWRVHVSLRHT